MNTAAFIPRTVETPRGVARLSAKRVRDAWYLVAAGPVEALRWMFIEPTTFERRGRDHARHVFRPARQPVKDVNTLATIADAWLRAWGERARQVAPIPAPPPNAHVQGITNTGAAYATSAAVSAPSTLGEVFDRFKAAQAGQVARNTLLKYEAHIGRWEAALGRDQLLTALTPSRVLEGRQTLGQRLSPVTVNNTTATLRRALGFALDEGWIAKLPFKGVKKLAEPVFSSGWWDAQEVSIALKAASADRHQPTALLMVALGVYLGLRKDEMVNLRWEDLQLDRRDPQGTSAPVCTVRCTASWMPKSRRQRTIPINTELRQMLLPHRKPAGYVLEPEKKRAKRGGTKRVYRFDCTKVWNRVRKAAVALEAKHIRFHDMRHTFASNQLISGTPAIKVARWLGHSSVEMVEKVYGHLLAHDDDINAVSYRSDEDDDGKVINFPGA